MTDELDDPLDDDALWHPARPQGDKPITPARTPAARLISRLYAAASTPLRARMLAGLLRPLSPLGLAAVAAGAFAGFVHRGGADSLRVAAEDAGRFTSEQVFELARFVEQVRPDALQQAASLVADNPMNAAAFSVAVAMLLLRSKRPRSPDAPPSPPA